jgi:hypothetical protein
VASEIARQACPTMTKDLFRLQVLKLAFASPHETMIGGLSRTRFFVHLKKVKRSHNLLPHMKKM